MGVNSRWQDKCRRTPLPQAQSPNAYARFADRGTKNAGLNFKQIIKCARIFRGTKSLNFEIFLYTVSIGRKIPSGVIAPVKRISGRYQSPIAARLQ
nr:MAG TPA: hypothetical protein [Caudoviricetes sp.]